MSNSVMRSSGWYYVSRAIAAVMGAALVSLLVHTAVIFPPSYLFRGRPYTCSNVRLGMSLEQIRADMRQKASPQQTEFVEDKLYILNGEDACTIYFDQSTSRVSKVEKSLPPITL